MTNKKESKESLKVLGKMKERRLGLEQGKLAHEGGQEQKMKGLKEVPEMDKSPMKEEKESKHQEGEAFLKHPRVKAVKQKKLVNDTAYFLHHPQIKPHGPSMPPKKPRD